ncbi:hypothetical protein CspHIS471_0303510 [Cutaneotrichosporon sp. HIS471]|nr:hypothetical protein CspHIS471_0303510 [Cutaneotrichosporon sp. HIS471]
MLTALLTLLPSLVGLTTAAPVPDYSDPSWTPYPDPNPTPAYPDYAWPDHGHMADAWTPSYKTGCDVSSYHLPEYNYHDSKWEHWDTWKDMMVPEGQYLKMTTVGRGVQTYTCTSGVYVSTGANADLYDTSCAYTDEYQSFAPNLPYYVYDGVPYPWTDGENKYRYIKHEFVDYNGQHVPKWTRTTDSYYMYGKKVASYTPDKKHIPWLRLEYIPMETGYESYLLAKTVLRTDTVGGVPAPSCHEEGKTVSIPYAANYYFYA